MPEKTPAIIFNDEPSMGSNFYFPQYAKTISDIIAYKKNKTPLTIGIYGPWGTGKTSLMKLIKENLEKYKNDSIFRPCKTVWFQAWKYADEEKILAALIEEIFRTMKQDDSFFQWLKATIEEAAKSASPLKLFSYLSKAITGGTFDITDHFGKLGYKDKLSFIHTFDKYFCDLIYCYITFAGLKISEDQKVSDEKGVLVIFIDDLDRCPKSRILNVLESIKLFLDKECCVFVIGADRDIVTGALKEPYPEGAGKFLEKIVQLSFILPKIDDDSGKKYLDNLKKDSILEKISPVLIANLGHNPHRIKRLINDYNFMIDLAANRYEGEENPIDPENLLCWLIIETVYPDFAKLVREKSLAYVSEIKNSLQQLEGKMTDEEKNAWRVNEDKIKEIGASDVKLYLQDRNFINIIRNFPSEDAKIKPYISFTASVAIQEKETIAPVKEIGFDIYSKVILKGKFKIEKLGKEVEIEKDFEMGIYPVTNSQYDRFVDAGGYENDGYWSDEGINWRNKEKISFSRYKEEEKWNKPEYPVVGVSWYEAEAYCKWLSKHTGQNYRLPTEAEWEKAAGWDEENKVKRIYPWGNEFNKDKCNTAESGIGYTTPVNQYPNGKSSYGCYDMAGNVLEWTSSWYDEKNKGKVLRGGSWDNDQEVARCALRIRDNPVNRYFFIGFRCARTL